MSLSVESNGREAATFWQRLQAIADRPQDNAEERAKHRLLLFAGTLMSGGGMLWGSISAYGGLWEQSLVPYGYVVVTALNFVALALWKNFRLARLVQVGASILLPFLFQWVLGGFGPSGSMMLWGMVGLIGSLSFEEVGTSFRWIILFLVLVVVSAVLEARSVLVVPAGLGGHQLSVIFFALNFTVVPSVVFGLALYFARSREAAIQTLAKTNAQLAVSKREAEEASKRADAANEAKGRFLAVVSHEIRTPLHGVLGLTHLVLDTDLTPRQHELLTQALVSAESLLAVINDVLDFSKIEAGAVTLERIPFRIDEVLDKLTSAATALAMKRGIEFVLQVEGVPPVLVGDPTRLGQILINLVSNAVKFTEQGEVVVHLHGEPDGDGLRLEASVRDTGIGIPEDIQAALFEPFAQADDSTTRRFGGTGLGLSICRHFVELMGGEISVESEPGEGSTFRFTARFGCGEQGERAIPDQLDKVRALIVDDNESARDVLSGYLQGFSIAADAVESAEQALEAVRDVEYGLVLTDLRMQGMDGIELIRHLRQAPRTAKARLLLVTAFGGRKDRDDAEKAGADGFITKPVRPSQLLDSLVDLYAPEGRPAVQPRSHKPRDPGLRGARVLVVEDNDINREIVVSALGAVGIACETAVDGQDGVDAVTGAGSPFDAVLMDLQMPRMDGLEATRRIRKTHPELPIVGVTANALADARGQCLEAGMNDVVTKPIHMGLLFSALQRLIGAKSGEAADIPDTPDAPDASNLPAIAGIDTNDGLARSGGNVKLYRDLLRRFAQGQGGAARTISAALEKGDTEQADRVVHTLKGVAGNIGALEVHELAQRFRHVLEQGDEAQMKELLDKLDTQLRTIVEALHKATEPSPGSDSGTSEVDLGKLRTLIADSDSEATDWLAARRRALGKTVGEAKVAELASALDAFDFARAQEIMSEVGSELERGS
jgi:two-component system sensor histidine kinase/response regulator